MTQVNMDLSALGGTVQGNFGTYYPSATSPVVAVDSRDAAALLAAGGNYIKQASRFTTLLAAPRAGSAGRLVASTSFANGTLSIANQPDVPRRGNVILNPGTTAVTAGNIAITYLANDGTNTTDNISGITAASQILTASTSKGIVTLTSAIITAVAGGTSPGVQIDDSNSLSVFVDPGFSSFTCIKETADNAGETVGTVASSAASITPTTTPNGTHTFGFGYTYNSPTS